MDCRILAREDRFRYLIFLFRAFDDRNKTGTSECCAFLRRGCLTAPSRSTTRVTPGQVQKGSDEFLKSQFFMNQTFGNCAHGSSTTRIRSEQLQHGRQGVKQHRTEVKSGQRYDNTESSMVTAGQPVR